MHSHFAYTPYRHIKLRKKHLNRHNFRIVLLALVDVLFGLALLLYWLR